MQLDPKTGQILYTLPEQFEVDYNSFGIKLGGMSPLVDNPTGLDGTMTNVANDPVGVSGLISGQSGDQQSLAAGYIQSANFVDYYVNPSGAIGWQINSDGSVQFNSGLFRGALTVGGNAWHVDISGNMWWGNYATYAAAVAAGATRIAANGAAVFTSLVLSGYIPTGGALSDTQTSIGAGGLSAITANIGAITAGSVTGVTITGVTITGGVLQTANTTTQRIVISGATNNLIFYDSANKPRLEIDGTGLTLLNSIGAQSTIINTDANGLTLTGAGGVVFIGASGTEQLTADTLYAISSLVAGNDITLNGDTITAWPSGAGTLSALSIDTSKNWGGYEITNLAKIRGNGTTNVIDLSIATRFAVNQNWGPDVDNARTCGIYDHRWSDMRTVQINGVIPLAGTKVYYVANTSGGAVNRKLTFVEGILQSET